MSEVVDADVKVEMIRADTLSRYPEQQVRAGADASLIQEYATAMLEGATFPPVVVFEDSDGARYLADGHHRVEATCLAALKRKQKRPEIMAEIRLGDQKDAIRYALQANKAHGKRMTEKDYYRAYSIARDRGLFRSTNAKALINEVKAVLGCWERLAYDLTEQERRNMVTERNRRIMDMLAEGVSDRDIAKALGVSHPTVAQVVEKSGKFLSRGKNLPLPKPPKAPKIKQEKQAAKPAVAAKASKPVDKADEPLTILDVSSYLPGLERLLLDTRRIEDTGEIGDLPEIETPDAPGSIQAISDLIESLDTTAKGLVKDVLAKFDGPYSEDAAKPALQAIKIMGDFLADISTFIREGQK